MKSITRTGVFLALATAVISGVSIFLNKFAVKAMEDMLPGSVLTLSVAQWGWVIVASALLLGYVTTWYAALKRAPATIVTSVLTIRAVITAVLNVALDGSALVAERWIGLLIMVAGIALMISILRIGKREHARLTA